MNQALLIVGVFVFFISVYGAVMVGGHLLAELGRAEPAPESPPVSSRSADPGVPAKQSS